MPASSALESRLPQEAWQRLSGRGMSRPGPVPQPEPAAWTYSACRGRLVELSGFGATAMLSLAFSLVHDAQQQQEQVAWTGLADSTFFPPDVPEHGIDLDSLVVVHVEDTRQAVIAADRLLRSGGFGLVVLDLSDQVSGGPTIPTPHQGRLVVSAQAQDAAVLCLTDKRSDRPSLGSLVSLRGMAKRELPEEGVVRCVMHAVKDKRHGPYWSSSEAFRVPDGLH